MKIDLCPDRADYYTQLNNEVNPYISCQTTAMVNGLDLVFRNLEPVKKAAGYRQPEDCLYHYICEDADVLNFYKRNHPESSIPAPEWADVLCFAVNRLYGKAVVFFDGNITPEKIIQELVKGLPVMVSMQ